MSLTDTKKIIYEHHFSWNEKARLKYLPHPDIFSEKVFFF